MDAVLASAIAVTGTLLGATLTYFFQRRSLRTERLRQERMYAYSTFAGRALEYRRVADQLWVATNDQTTDEGISKLREDAFRARYIAQEAAYRVRLTTNDATLGNLADAVVNEITTIDKSTSNEQFERRRGRTRHGIRTFVEAARKHLPD